MASPFTGSRTLPYRDPKQVLHRIYIRCRSFMLHTPFPIFSKSGRKLLLTQVVLLDLSYTSYKKLLKSMEPLRRCKQNCAADALRVAMMTKIFGLVSTISSTHRWQHARLSPSASELFEEPLFRQYILSLSSRILSLSFVAALCCAGVGRSWYYYKHKIYPMKSYFYGVNFVRLYL
jgi:hypothetical protein